MRTGLAVGIAIIGAAGIAGCVDEPTALVKPAEDGRGAVQADAPTEPGVRMRLQLRAMDDSVFERRVAESDNVVTVGFRQAGAFRGVSARGEVLVPAGERSQRVAAVEAMAAEVIYEFGGIPAMTIRVEQPSTATQLRHLPWVDYVAYNGRRTRMHDASGCDPVTPQFTPWNIERIQADRAWQIATGSGAPKQFTLLDDGADETGTLWHSTELYWTVQSNYVGSDPDSIGLHGTQVLSVGIARDNSYGIVGVAPTASARVGVIADYREPKGYVDESAVAQAIDEHDDYTTVFNMNFGESVFVNPPEGPEPPSSYLPVHSAITHAYYQKAVLFVAAPGNAAESYLVDYPGYFDEVIGVGGSGIFNEHVLNNYGPGNIEISAPAIDIPVVCKGGEIGESDGTSLATPAVAGAIMLLREEFPFISNDSLRARLRNTAEPMEDTLKSGAGRINVFHALLGGAPQPPEVSISGPTLLLPGGEATWTASVSGGTAPFWYTWYYESIGTQVGTGSSWSGGVQDGDLDNEFTLIVHVVDKWGLFGSAEIFVQEASKPGW